MYLAKYFPMYKEENNFIVQAEYFKSYLKVILKHFVQWTIHRNIEILRHLTLYKCTVLRCYRRMDNKYFIK